MFIIKITSRATAVPVVHFSPEGRFVYVELSVQSLIHWAESSASAVVLTFLVHAECIPGSRAEDVVLRHVVHRHRNAQY